MKRVRLAAICAFWFAGQFPHTRASGASPLGKALGLIRNLTAQIVTEGEEAQKVYDAHVQFCQDRSRTIQREVKTANGRVARLESEMAQEESKITQETGKVDEQSSNIATYEADLKAATTIRNKEEKDFQELDMELADTIDTLTRASQHIERDASLAQLSSARDTVKALGAMVLGSVLGASEADQFTTLAQNMKSEPYDSKTGGIADTLQDLRDRADAKLDETRKEETNRRHNFEMLQQSLQDQIKFGNQELATAKQLVSTAKEAKAAAEGDLSMTKQELGTDMKVLGDLRQECMGRAQDFKAEITGRGEELEALGAAQKSLEECSTDASFVAYPGPSLLQVSASKNGSGVSGRVNAARLVRELARRHNSAVLAQLAARMGAVPRDGGRDPFGKLRELLGGMVAKFEGQADAAATEHAFCEKERVAAEEKKEDKTTDVEKLSTQIDKCAANSAQLKDEVSLLQKGLADLESGQAEMDRIRQEEHGLFEKDKARSEEGLEGVKVALRVLINYYSSADDKPHGASGGAAGGIIGLLQVVESDFTKTLAEITGAEDSARERHDTETKDNQVEKATKELDVKYKLSDIARLDSACAETRADQESTQAQLDAVLEYLAKLEERCVGKADTYEKRQAARQEELNGLREALEAVEVEAAANFLQVGAAHHVLRGSRRRHRALQAA